MRKKTNNISNFNIPIASFHGVCDLIGSYILNKVTLTIRSNYIGLNRNMIWVSQKQQEDKKLKKSILKKISQMCFEITIDIGKTSTNLFKIHLNLVVIYNVNNFQPYQKSNPKTKYINNGSNHPKKIRENIPKIIKKRISKLRKNKV